MKLRIAQVDKFFFLKGGAEKVMFDEADLLRQAGHEVEFFSMHHPQNPENYEYSKYFVDYVELSNLGKEYNFLEKIKIASNIIYNRKAAINFEKFLNDFKPDIVHCHNIASQITPSILAVAKRHNIPVVLTLHDYYLVCPAYTLLKEGKHICKDLKCLNANYWNCAVNKCIKNSFSASILGSIQLYFSHYSKLYTNNIDKFISPSNFLRDIVISSGIPEERIVYIPNSLDLNTYQPEYSNQDYFMFIGRLSYEKGLFTLLDSFKALPDINLKIIGTGPIEQSLKEYKEKNSINNVEFEGYQSGEDLARYYKNSKAVIIPSEWHENAPMTVIESFGYGKPVIATNLGGIPEMIDNNVNGIVFEAKNASELIQAVEKLNSDDNLLVEMGKNGRNKAESLYDASVHIKKVLALYDSLVQPASREILLNTSK